MFISIGQLEKSIAALGSLHPFFGIAFLAFKKVPLPIGSTIEVKQSRVCEEFLKQHFQPTQRFDQFFSPFQSSKSKSKEGTWLASDYGSSGLQRICADTFGDAFIHEKNTSDWGWNDSYVEVLKSRLKDSRIPMFHLGAWIFRDRDWGKTSTSSDIEDVFTDFFNITDVERRSLFELSSGNDLEPFGSSPVSETELLQLIGHPPGELPPGGALLKNLSIKAVGPATSFDYAPSSRLNLITGDNSLGKTFLLDVIWWALAETWCGYPAIPRRDVPKTKPEISFEVSTGRNRISSRTAKFKWEKQAWEFSSKDKRAVAGLVIYARHDGSFAIWDPSRMRLEKEFGINNGGQVVLDSDAVWRGSRKNDASGRQKTVCNGLVADWLLWQLSGSRYKHQYEALTSALLAVSPLTESPLVPGDPYRFPLDSQEVPTLKMAYGDVPIPLASAGIQRAIALAYVLVWSWHEHVMNSKSSRVPPQRRLVLLVDEVEAHLHPRWQRTIVPALMNVANSLSDEVNAQLHFATHSPLVLASAESIFDYDQDALHHLQLSENNVVLEEIPFVKYGRVDRWLMSDIFGLEHARSVEAELAIEDAKKAQLRDIVDSIDINEIHQRLVKHLSEDDEFWPRWLYFAEQNGVIL